MPGVWTSIGYAAVGGAAVGVGATVGTLRPPAPRTLSLVQHAAAGTVLAGLVVDVFPKLLDRPDEVWPTALGMVAGLVAMLLIRAFVPTDGSAGLGALGVTVIVDVLVDGVLIGLSTALGASTGLLFAVSLAPEMGLLGVTAASALARRRTPAQVITTGFGIGAAITAAGGLGWLVADVGSAGLTVAVLGIGASVIVYLVLEELLREAHETAVGTLEVAVLFGSFLPLFLVGVALG